MTRPGWLIVAGVLWATSLQAEPPLLVGEYGDVERMEFRGNNTFSTPSIRTALGCQLELLPAAARLSSLSTLLNTVSELVQRGYHDEGFGDAVIETMFDEQTECITVTISEGPRYREGKVHISGVADDLEQVLRDAALKGVPPEDAELVSVRIENGVDVSDWRDAQGKPAKLQPLWGQRDHASLSSVRLRWIERELEAALERQGYVGADLTVQLLPQADRSIDLQVDVRDVGRTVEITDVTIQGAAHNSHQAICDLIDIHPGEHWTLASRMLAERRLRKCGRFFHAGVALVPSTTDPLQGTVHVRVRESETIPPLGKPLTPVDQTLLKCADWLESLPHGEFDIVTDLLLERPSGPLRVRLVVSPERGMLADVSVAGPAGQPYRYVVMTDLQQWSLVSTHTRRRFDITTTTCGSTGVRFTVRGKSEIDSAGRQCMAMFGLKVSNADEPYRPVQFSIEPVVFLHDARREGTVCQQEDGVALVQGPKTTARIDVETGRLLSLELNANDAGHSQLRIVTQPDAYGRIRAELDELIEGIPNVADEQHLFASLVEFLTAEFSAIAREIGMDELAARVIGWQRLLMTHAVPRLEALFERIRNSEEQFVIPPPAAESGLQVHWVGSMILQGNALLFAHDATPAMLGRELTAALLLQDTAALQRAVRIGQSTTTGPLTCWYAAEVLRLVSPQLGQAFAQSGLKRIQTHHLRHDLRELLKGSRLVGNALRDTAEALHELPADQVDQLFDLVPGSPQRAALIERFSQPAANRDETLAAIVELIWETWAQELVKSRLQQLAQPSSPPAVAVR